MIKKLMLITAMFMAIGCSKEVELKAVELDDLIEVNGLFIHSETGEAFTGTYQMTIDGFVYTKGKMEHGVNHGLQESWYRNGRLEHRTNWQFGKPHGLEESYSESGELISKTYYEDGVEIPN
jgi:antitoxin component YwqK of YwqJK toxin-antitoxin module